MPKVGDYDAVTTPLNGSEELFAKQSGATKKVTSAELAAWVGSVKYVDAWNAATNTPAIPAAAEENKGFYYIVAVAGSTDIDGITDWEIGDWIISNGTAWSKVDNSGLFTRDTNRIYPATVSDKVVIGSSDDVNAELTVSGSLAIKEVGSDPSIATGHGKIYSLIDPTINSLDEHTQVLISSNTTDGSVIFTDSTGNQTLAPTNYEHDTTRAKFGTSSWRPVSTTPARIDPNLFTSVPNPSLGFTVDFWVFLPSAWGVTESLIPIVHTGAFDMRLYLSNRRVRFSTVDAVGEIYPANLLPLNQWVHLAFQYDPIAGDAVYMAGQLIGSNASSAGSTLPAYSDDGTDILNISDTVSPYVWLDEFRYSSIARYSESFAPPEISYNDIKHANLYYIRGNGDTVKLDQSANVDALESIVADTQEPNGYNRNEPTTMGDIAFTAGTRLFEHSVQAGETEFYVYSNGTKHTKTSTQSVTLDNTTGLHYIYYDGNGDLQKTMVYDADFLYKYGITSIIYWNATDGDYVVFSDERHGIQMDGATHARMHRAEGAKLDQSEGGLDISGLSAGGTTYTGIASGVAWDEDIRLAIDAAVTHQFWYRDGASGGWRATAADGNTAYNGGAGTTYYNQDLGAGAWQLTHITAGYFSIVHYIYNPNNGGEVSKVIGQAQYANRNAARAAIESEIFNLKLNGLPTPEFVFLYSTIVADDLGIETLADGSLFVDFRELGVGSGGQSADAATSAINVATDVTNFNGALSSADTDVQKALETLDDHNHSVLPGYGETIYDLTTSAAIDVANGNNFKKTITGATTWAAFDNDSKECVAFTIRLTNGGSATCDFATNNSVEWTGGSVPDFTASGVDLVTFYTQNSGTTWTASALLAVSVPV